MKVLILQDWNLLQGGAEAYTLNLRGALTAAGDEVRLLSANVSSQARRLADYLAPASDHVAAKSLLQIHNPLAAAAVRAAVRQFQPHAALVNMFALYLSPGAVFALGKVPYVLLVSDYKCTCPRGHRLLPDRSVCHQPQGIACLRSRCLSIPHWLRDQLRYRGIGEVLRRAAAIVSTSDALRDNLAEQGIASRRIYMYSGSPDAVLPRLPAPTPLFLFVGRLDVEKGVDILLQAFAILLTAVPESRLRIVGRGAQRPELELLADRLGLVHCVQFCGWREPAEIEHELSHAWALVAPSRWPEPFGLVALEAIFRAVPAVVPAHGGFAETVEHGVTGLMYPPNDVTVLADRLLELATGRSFPEHAVDAAHVAAAQRRFGRERHVAEIRALLRAVVVASESNDNAE